MNRIVITELEHRGKTYTAYIVLNEKREFEELQVFAPKEEGILGHIYVGRIEKVADNVHAAFVRIGDGRKCYLPLEDIKSPVYVRRQSAKKALCEGDELLVQVTREAVKTKEAVVSTKLALHGSYCLLTTDNTCIGVSHKLAKDRAEELASLAEKVCAGHEDRGYGILLRTNAGGQSDEVLADDMKAVAADYEKLLTAGIHRCQGELVYAGLPGYLARLKKENMSAADFIYTDVPAVYEEIAERLPALAKDGKLKLYRDPAVSLAALYHIRGNIQNLLNSRVWLPSGANIIIESLETLTVIDVNSGKNVSQKPSALFSVNLESAREIARQLRLRNISGMIIVDFINMKSEEEKEALISYLKQELKKDSVPAKFIDMTKLGLVEITRRKEYRPLREILRLEP